MKIPRLLTRLSRLLVVATAVFGSLSAHAATTFPSVLSVGPFDYPGPTYFYINTKIPFETNVAPQIRITGYMYGGANKAMDVTLGWYMWNNAFFWTQFHSELSFAKPSRIRLGTYDDAGTTRVRIEIANDGVYWASYFVSATDILGYDPYYTGWSYGTGALPGNTGLITEVPVQGDVQISGNLTAANFANGAITGGTSGLALNAGGSSQNVTLTPSGSGYTILNGNVGIGTPSPLGKFDVKLATNQHVAIYNNGGVTTLAGLNDAGNLASLKLEGSPLMFGGAGGVEHVRIDSAGKVGIGTTIPSAKLHVVATSLNESNTVNFTDTIKLQAANGAHGGIALQSAWDNALNTSKLNFRLGYYASGHLDRDVLTMVANTGYVGIGIASPGAPLEIKKPNGGGRFQFLDEGADVYSAINVRNSANNAFQPLTLRSAGFSVNDGTANGLTVAVGGNVGIGTPGPMARADIYESAAGTLLNTALKLGAYTGSVGGGPFLDFNLRWGGNYPNWIGGRIGSVYETNSLGQNRTALVFHTNESNDGTQGAAGTTEKMRIRGDGNVGIGTTNPGLYKLAVNGTIHAKEIIVDNTNWADYVFDSNYRLAPLSEVEQHIKTEKHLPGIPSAAEIAEHGVSMGDMQSKLLSKIEELTLHMIAQEKRIERLEQENQQLKAATNQ